MYPESKNIRRRELVHENKRQRVYRVELETGRLSKEYFVTETGERAGIVIVRGDSVLLTGQYRLIIDGPSWEIPGGRVDAGETPETAAVRECFEETGIRCFNLKPLITYHPGLDTIYNPTHIFHANEFEESEEFKPDIKEVESLKWFALKDVFAMIKGGEISDCFTIIGLFTYKSAVLDI